MSNRDKETQEEGHEARSSQRLDKWLWCARVAKTRTLAAELVEQGRIRVNRVRAGKPSSSVRPGDVLTIAMRGNVRLLKVVQTADRRGPPAAARQLYEELLAPTSPGRNGI
jgi:ribosome-associated heat shock protein Hsp15